MSSDAIAQTSSDVKVAVRIPARPPAISGSSSEEYMEACARSNSRASITSPLCRHFEAEKLPPLDHEEYFTDVLGNRGPTSETLLRRISRLSDSELEAAIYKACVGRLHNREPGAFVAEAGNFAASTCWEPRCAPAQIDTNLSEKLVPVPNRTSPDRPVFTLFNAKIEAAKRKYLYPVIWKHASTASSDYLARPVCPFTRKALALNASGDREDPRLLYWKLSMTSRDPAVQPPVPGAVRAVIEPYVKRWVEEDSMPAIWLEAGGPRARDVYQWLGFRAVDEIHLGHDAQGEPIIVWCMIYTKE